MNWRIYFLSFAVLLLISCSDDPAGPAPPELSIEYTSLNLEVERYVDKEFEYRVRNTGEDDLILTDIETDVYWMTIDQQSMTVIGGSVGVLNIMIVTDLAPANEDELFGRLRFKTNDPHYANVQISVDVTIGEATYDPMSVSPTSILLTMASGSDTTKIISVSNPGVETHSIESIQTSVDWITVDPDTMTLRPGERGTLVLGVTTVGLTTGTYEGRVSILTDDPYAGSLGTIIITVTLNVVTEISPTRVVVAEEFTGTWCQFCPVSMQALHELEEYAPDNVAVVVYHLDDGFEATGNETRRQYYGILFYPHVQFDGIVPVTGEMSDYSLYFGERYDVQIPLSLQIDLITYNALSGDGAAEVRMNSIVDSTLAFNFRMFLTGLDSTYSWQDFDHLYNTVLVHVTETAGTPIQLDPLSSETRTFDFTVPADWRGRECELVGFAQHDPTKEILQGAKIAVP